MKLILSLSNFLFISFIVLTTSCGPSEQEQLSELNNKINRLVELKKNYSDSLDKLAAKHKDEIDAWGKANSKSFITSGGYLDSRAFSDSLYSYSKYIDSRDSSFHNHYMNERERVTKELEKFQAELDKMLNIK